MRNLVYSSPSCQNPGDQRGKETCLSLPDQSLAENWGLLNRCFSRNLPERQDSKHPSQKEAQPRRVIGKGRFLALLAPDFTLSLCGLLSKNHAPSSLSILWHIPTASFSERGISAPRFYKIYWKPFSAKGKKILLSFSAGLFQFTITITYLCVPQI